MEAPPDFPDVPDVDAPDVGGNWFILLGVVPALLGLAAACWVVLNPPRIGPPPPPPPPPSATAPAS